jgi:hypothetical protein
MPSKEPIAAATTSAEVAKPRPAGPDIVGPSIRQRDSLNRHALTPDHVLRLQRVAGNHAVGQLIGHGTTRESTEPDIGAVAAEAPERGLVLNPEPGEIVRGRTFWEFLGDVARPVGTFFGNIVGGVAGAVTGTGISTTDHTTPSWSPGGVFDWQVEFTTGGRNGWIVQEITNGWRGETAAGAAVASPFSAHYWEAWAVDGSGNVTPAVGGVNDFWTNPDLTAAPINAAKGHWWTTGKVHFTTVDPATQGFITNNPATNAGILLSSTSAPAALNLGIGRLRRYAQGTWDSTGATSTHDGRAGP